VHSSARAHACMCVCVLSLHYHFLKSNQDERFLTESRKFIKNRSLQLKIREVATVIASRVTNRVTSATPLFGEDLSRVASGEALRGTSKEASAWIILVN